MRLAKRQKMVQVFGTSTHVGDPGEALASALDVWAI